MKRQVLLLWHQAYGLCKYGQRLESCKGVPGGARLIVLRPLTGQVSYDAALTQDDCAVLSLGMNADDRMYMPERPKKSHNLHTE